ncbi:hypothetical protein CWR48_02910 [Oceanobacillus arenosus]|uniref:Uncharacterized protein n=1 Tax=Oceanobacillus arenosus TaxID=1229153 RepID=A0A3D8Q1C7_9BACI|nr:hypothetical protein [Oceanobacillus arenosus]RDW21371.1 hypothetical protein CWR48_02910 [Oceanobacillus arenosus]
MALYSALSKLQDVYEKLEEGFYSIADFPLPEDKFLNHDPYISSKLFDEFLDIIHELSDLLEGSRLIEEVLNLIEEDSPINNLVMFNEQNYAIDLTNKNPASYNEEDLSSVQEQSSQKAHEEKSNLFNEASEDIKRLMEELLPLLIQ